MIGSTPTAVHEVVIVVAQAPGMMKLHPDTWFHTPDERSVINGALDRILHPQPEVVIYYCICFYLINESKLCGCT